MVYDGELDDKIPRIVSPFLAVRVLYITCNFLISGIAWLGWLWYFWIGIKQYLLVVYTTEEVDPPPWCFSMEKSSEFYSSLKYSILTNLQLCDVMLCSVSLGICSQFKQLAILAHSIWRQK